MFLEFSHLLLLTGSHEYASTRVPYAESIVESIGSDSIDPIDIKAPRSIATPNT